MAPDRATLPRPLLLPARIAALLILLAGPAMAHPEVTGPDGTPDPRYGDRRSLTPRQGSFQPAEDLVPAAERLVFSSFVDEIVERLDLATYDRLLQELTGWVPATVGGSPYTFHTRYSASTGGALSWQYAFEQLEAMGYKVRYQSYTRGGLNLKNVIATLPGTVTPERIYVIGGHIDSVSPDPYNLAPGAEDNGSGSAGVLAAAAALAGERFESTIELCLFSGEEQGLWGSDAYVDEAVAEGWDVRSAVTMDMISYWTNEYGVLIEGETAWASLMQNMADAVDRYTDLGRQFSYFSFGSDHVPFQDAGIPAILAIDLDWDEYPYYHRTTDTYDKTIPAFAAQIARAGLATIAQMAGPLGPSSVEIPGSSPAWASAPLRVWPNPARSTAEISLAGAPAPGPAPGDGAAPPRHEPTENAPPGTGFGDGPRLVIVNASGRVVRALHDAETDPAAGQIRWRWDLRDASGRAVSPGLYWARSGSHTGRLLVIR